MNYIVESLHQVSFTGPKWNKYMISYREKLNNESIKDVLLYEHGE